jgi:hypothetical protein
MRQSAAKPGEQSTLAQRYVALAAPPCVAMPKCLNVLCIAFLEQRVTYILLDFS